MQKKWINLVVSVVLGVVIPGVIFTLFYKFSSMSDVPISPTDVTTLATDEIQDSYISVLMENGNIHNMELDTYLTSVVLQEMPAHFESEALKAQSVVARTYTLRRDENNEKHVGAAVCTNPTCCQGYCSVEDYLMEGGNQDSLDKVKNAVKATEGQVLTYQGELIEATYFSCSGGSTEDAKAVWGTDIPYLQAKESPGEEKATYFTDTVYFSVEDFEKLFDGNLSGNPETWVDSITYTNGGGVDTIRLCGKDYKGTDLRQRLGLRSTAFVITAIGNTVTITTKGFGHRVGMSQYGADAMALNGNTYQQILSYYYPGTELVWHEG